ncbi:hypothetical protein [Paraburkholderia sp. GAS32]|jgi:hypothetical protein
MRNATLLRKVTISNERMLKDAMLRDGRAVAFVMGDPLLYGAKA